MRNGVCFGAELCFKTNIVGCKLMYNQINIQYNLIVMSTCR